MQQNVLRDELPVNREKAPRRLPCRAFWRCTRAEGHHPPGEDLVCQTGPGVCADLAAEGEGFPGQGVGDRGASGGEAGHGPRSVCGVDFLLHPHFSPAVSQYRSVRSSPPASSSSDPVLSRSPKPARLTRFGQPARNRKRAISSRMRRRAFSARSQESGTGDRNPRAPGGQRPGLRAQIAGCASGGSGQHTNAHRESRTEANEIPSFSFCCSFCLLEVR